MKSTVTRPTSAVVVGASSSGDGGGSNGSTLDTDKQSAKLPGSKSGPKGDHVSGEKANEQGKKKGKLQRLEVGPQKLNEKNGPENQSPEKSQEGLENVTLPLENGSKDIPLPPQQKLNDKEMDKERNSKERQISNNEKDDDNKSGVVSFSFKKTGAKLGTTVFNTEEDEKHEENSDVKMADKPKKILSAFTRVKNKDGTMELDWPSEMIQHTTTEPSIMFSCNPLMFDFTALFSKPSNMSERLKFLTEEDKKVENNEKLEITLDVELQEKPNDESAVVQEESVNDVSSSKSKSKKKKKRKHKKHHKESKTDKEKGEEGEKKKKRKKKKHEDKEEDKENQESASKKRSYRKRTADSIAESGNESESKKSKHKKRKKSKKSKKKKKQTEEGVEGKKSNEKTPKKSKAKKSSNVLEHLIDEVDGTDIKIKKEDSSDKMAAKKSIMKTNLNFAETDMKQVTKTTATDAKLTTNPVKTEKESGSTSSRKRQTSESSHSEATPSSVKKQKLTPRLSKEPEKSAPVKQEDTWSKIENIYEPKIEENPKSKWDTSDSESEHKLDNAVKKKKIAKKTADPAVKKETPVENEKPAVKTEETAVVKRNSKSKSYDSSDRSWSRSRSKSRHSRSYSHSSSRSRSRSYSTTSYDSRSRSRSSSYSRSRSRSRRYRSSSYSSYSSEYSRSRSRSSRRYSRSRSRYSSYSRSRSRSSRYSTSRSRSRSYSRSNSRHSKRSYSQSSHSSQGSNKVMNRKQRRKKTLQKKALEMNKIDPLSIPLPDLGKSEKTENDSAKLAEKIKMPDIHDTMSIPLPEKKNTSEKVENVRLLAPPPPPPGEQPVYNIPHPRMPNFMPPPPPPGMMGPGHGMYPGMPFDPRMRMPPPNYPNMPPPHYNGPNNYCHPPYSQDLTKSRSPPPLPPPRSPSPQPPPPPKKEEEKKEVEAMSMDIPPDQAEKFQKLKKQAQKHAMKQLKRQMRQLKGENPSDESSSEEEEEEQAVSQQGEEMEEEIQLLPIMSPSLSMGQPTYIITQPQQASSPLTHQIVVGSDGRQFIIPAAGVSQASLAGMPIQAGAPVFAMPGAGQPTLVALAPGAGATPAHLGLQSPFLTGGIPFGASAMLQGHHPFLAQSQLSALQHLHHQPQFIQSIQSSLGHGPIVIGNQILIPRIVRPAL